MLEYVKIYKEDEEIELQLSNKYIYSIINNNLLKKEKEFITEEFFSPQIENIFALVGANGSGKTSLIYNINEMLNEKVSQKDILKYILIIKIEKVFKVKTFNIELELPTDFEKMKPTDIENNFSKAIYHIGIDGNNIENQSIQNTMDLSLNYKFQNNKNNYKVFKEETVFNQLYVISQHPNLLSKIGIEDLNHPKEVSYSLNLKFLNNTHFKLYNSSYLVYIYDSNYIDFYYELDKIISDDESFVDFDIDWIVDLFEKKIFLCNEKDLRILLDITSKIKIKILNIQLNEIFNSYSRTALKEIRALLDSIESQNYIVSTFMDEIGIYYFEKVFIDFFKDLIKEFNINSIIHENIFNESFSINNDAFIEDIFKTIKDVNFIFNHFHNDKYIEELMINNEESFYMEALQLYFDGDIDNEDLEELENYKKRFFSNFKSINKKKIISYLEFINGDDPLNLIWEKDLNSFFSFVKEILLITIKNNIDFSGFLLEDYLFDLEVKYDPKYLLKTNNSNYSKQILKDMMSGIDEIISNKINKIYHTQRMSIKYFLNFMNHSTPTKNMENKSLSIKISSAYISDFFKKYGTNFAECIYKFEWRNMSSGEFAILNLLSNINRINFNVEKRNNLILFIDEGDLYLHPQWQKQFLYIVIKALEELLEFRNVYIILTTHSPFLVSDLPKENILFLNPLKDMEYNIENTFAANINELLATKFFIQGGLIGRFAKEKINNLYKEIIDKFNIEKIDYYKSAIEIIGEPLVKVELLEVLNKKINENRYKSLISKKLEEIDLEFDEDLLNEIYKKIKTEKV